MVVYIKSRAEMFYLKNNHADQIDKYNIISICDYFDPPEPVFEKDTDSIITLFFDDITKKDVDIFFPEYDKNKYKLFDKEMASKIISFVDKMDKSKPLIVHCYAGISRSSAVAVWVQYFYGTLNDVQNLFLCNENIKPNQFVLDTLMKLSKIKDRRDMSYEMYDYNLAKGVCQKKEDISDLFVKVDGVWCVKIKK